MQFSQKSQVQNISQKNWLLMLRVCVRVNFTLLMICIENPDSKKKSVHGLNFIVNCET